MMKMRRIVATVLVLTMVLVCLPMHTRAEVQRATLVPKTMEPVKTITTLEDGVIAFTTIDELISLCSQARTNPGKEYIYIYIGGHTLYITKDVTIPENVSVAGVYDNDITDVEISAGVTLNIYGHLEGLHVENFGTIRIYPTGTLYVHYELRTFDHDTFIDGTLVIDNGTYFSILGRDRLHFGDTGMIIVNGSVSTEAQFLKSCEEAEYRNNGHWVYVVELTGSGFQFTKDVVTIPANCSFFVTEPFYLGNANLDVYGYIDCSGPLVINGNLRIQPGGLLAVGNTVSIDGVLENYSEIAVVCGIDEMNGSLVLAKPQEYKDVRGFDRGQIIVATVAGQEYPTQALVGMDVNGFSGEWRQEDGKSFWILKNYQYAPPAQPEGPQEVTLVAGGNWEGGKPYWEVYSDGTLKIFGESYMQGATNSSYLPWKAYSHMINHIEITGIKQIAEEAFSDMPAVRSVSLGDSVQHIGERAFAECVGLEAITIPASVESIDEGAFASCSNLKEVTFAEGSKLRIIETAVFGWTPITKIEIPASVGLIKGYAFSGCEKLEEVVIPEFIEDIENFAFDHCYALKKITFQGHPPFFYAESFNSVIAEVYYPIEYIVWWDGNFKDYGGRITWISYCKNHTFTTEVVEPDCITPGTTTHTCSVCGEVQVDPEVLPPQGHNYGVDADGNPDFWDTTCDVCGAERVVDKHRPTHSMYRMYNPNSGEHFYTGSMVERQNLEAAGWKYEGVGFTFPATTGKPVYRLYDRDNTQEHLYTMDEAEKDQLLAEGWILEGVAFNSGREDEVPQYRLHNPNATIGAYHFTASIEEKDALIAAGWEYQGIGFYTCLQ